MGISGRAAAALLAVLLERPEEPVTLLRFHLWELRSPLSGVATVCHAFPQPLREVRGCYLPHPTAGYH